MIILKAKCENFKAIGAAEVALDPTGGVVTVCGANEVGKSSFIDSLATAIGGKKLAPAQPIREGKNKSTVTLDVGGPDGVILSVKRTWWRAKDRKTGEFTGAIETKLEVTRKDKPESSSQKVLDALWTKLGGFDVMEFDALLQTPEGQRKLAEKLRELVGLDFSGLEEVEDTTRENRKQAKARLADIKPRLAAIADVPADTPDEEVAADVLLKEFQAAVDHNGELDIEDTAIEIGDSDCTTLSADHSRLKTELAAKLAHLEEAVKALETLKAQRGKKERVDTAPLAAKLDGLQATNAAVRAKQQREALASDEAASTEAIVACNETIAACQQERKDRLAAAEFPVPDLSFDEDGMITHSGLPLAQASQSRRLRIWAALGFALVPADGIRVMFTRHGSNLDKASLALCDTLAREHEGQFIVERIERGDGKAVVEISPSDDGATSSSEERSYPVSKAPAEQWYHGDWLRDPAVRACSLAARGAWADLLSLMWQLDPNYKITGTYADFARLLGTTTRAATRAINELISRQACASRVTCHTSSPGRPATVTLISRRRKRVFDGREGARTRKRKQRASERHANVPPLSQRSSSSSSSSCTPQPPTGARRLRLLSEKSISASPRAAPSRRSPRTRSCSGRPSSAQRQRPRAPSS